MLDLNYHENAALVDAHAKKCMFCTQAESAHEETVAQRTSFAEMRRIPELEELMTRSYQSGYKIDQASVQLKVVVKLGDQYLSRGGGRFSSAYHSRSKLQEGTRDDQ